MSLSAGCFVIPEESEPEVTIVCGGGHYFVRPDIWSPTGCEGDDYPAGTFWINADGRIFLLGDPLPYAIDAYNVYGSCPTEFVEEIIFNGGE